MKTGSKYYGFKKWNENRVKFLREKEPENLGMKTWIPGAISLFLNITGAVAPVAPVLNTPLM